MIRGHIPGRGHLWYHTELIVQRHQARKDHIDSIDRGLIWRYPRIERIDIRQPESPAKYLLTLGSLGRATCAGASTASAATGDEKNSHEGEKSRQEPGGKLLAHLELLL